MVLVAFLGILYSLAEGISIGVVLPLLTQMTGQTDVSGGESRITALLFTIGKIVPNVHPFISALLVLFIATLLKNIFGYLREVLSVFIGLSSREHCQAVLFRRLLNVDYKFFLERRQGDLQYRVVTAPNQMGNLITLIPNLVTEVMKCLFIIVVLLSIAPKATFLVGVMGLLFLGIVRYLAANVSHYTGRGRADASSDMTVYCGQALQGIKMLKVFKAEKFWEGLFNKALSKFYKLARRDTLYIHLPPRALDTVAIGILCLVAGWVLVKSGIGQLVSIIPILGVFALALQRLIPSFNSIGREAMQFMALLPYAEASYSAISESSIQTMPKGGLPAVFDREIRFENVTLRYEGERKPVLNNVNIVFKKGSFSAIVGESGAGKTSILNLLLGIIPPTEGRILVDDIPLDQINKDKWFERIGYVGQEIFMFHGTIRDNILFGMQGVSDEKIFEALKISNALEFVEKCPKRLDTVIGDEGITLSGGQRQRLAIARALLRNPDILIFDEATSFLDNISEKLIKDAIINLARTKTIISAAHRFSSIADANVIIVLKEGQVLEVGSPDYLMQSGECFVRLYGRT